MLSKLFTAFLLLAPGIFSACNNSGKSSASFCDTVCLKDSLKFIKTENPLRPYVYISAKNCAVDTIIWSSSGMGENRKYPLPYNLNKNYVCYFINDTSYACEAFHLVTTGRGYC